MMSEIPPSRTTSSSLPTVLVIDEKLARDSAARAEFLRATNLTDCQRDTEGKSSPPVGFVEFCSGQVQTAAGWANDYQTIQNTVGSGATPSGWALALLNARFHSEPASIDDDCFGEEVYRKLSKEFPSVPVVQFTSKYQKELSHEVGDKYLCKEDLDRRGITETLLRHGRISPTHTRALLSLDRDTIAEAPRTLQVFSDAYVHADEDSPILLLGESGTGKEKIANFIHRNSHRNAGQFVGANMATITKDLAESILFGHLKGTFTGATEDRKGLFEQAEGGTLFLDELGDMPLDLQAKLLRAIQEREIPKLGAKAPIKVSVRLVCATSANLPAAIAEGRFRRDLYYRLAGVTLVLPPLRERPEDIPPLAVAFLRREQETQKKKGIEFCHDALEALAQHPFLGNVRELELLVQRLVGRTGNGRALLADDVHAQLKQTILAEPPPAATATATMLAAPPITTLAQLLAAIEGFEPRMDELEGAKPALETAATKLLGRLAETAMARYRRVDGSDNVMGAMSLLAGRNLSGTQAKQVWERILKDLEAEAVALSDAD